MAAQPQLCFDAVADRVEPLFVEARANPVRPHAAQAGQGGASPQLLRLMQQGRRPLIIATLDCGTCLFVQIAEPVKIDSFEVRIQRVATGASAQPGPVLPGGALQILPQP